MNTQFQYSRTASLAFMLLLCSLALSGCIIEPNPSPHSDGGDHPGAPTNLTDFSDHEAPRDKCSEASEEGELDERCPLGNAGNTCDDADCGPDCGGCERGDSCQDGECFTLADCTPSCGEKELGMNDGCGGICTPGIDSEEGSLEENEIDLSDHPLENPTNNNGYEIPESE